MLLIVNDIYNSRVLVHVLTSLLALFIFFRDIHTGAIMVYIELDL